MKSSDVSESSNEDTLFYLFAKYKQIETVVRFSKCSGKIPIS